MSSSMDSILADRDVNASAPQQGAEPTKEIKSMDYHRQMLQSKLADDQDKLTYVSPSDGIMSPCTAKLNAYKNKHVMKAKPKSLFQKNLADKAGNNGAMFADKPAASEQQ